MTTYDVEKVRADIAAADEAVRIQQLVVDSLADLLDDEQRDLVNLERAAQRRREAWAAHGVEL